jgi:hypothetical protein
LVHFCNRIQDCLSTVDSLSWKDPHAKRKRNLRIFSQCDTKLDQMTRIQPGMGVLFGSNSHLYSPKENFSTEKSSSSRVHVYPYRWRGGMAEVYGNGQSYTVLRRVVLKPTRWFRTSPLSDDRINEMKFRRRQTTLISESLSQTANI